MKKISLEKTKTTEVTKSIQTEISCDIEVTLLRTFPRT